MAKKLGEILVEKDLITTEQLEEATEIQCLYGGKLGTSLIELGAVDEETLTHVLSTIMHLPYFKPTLLMEVPQKILELVPRTLALKHMTVPCKLEGKKLFLAMSDPSDLSALDELSFKLGYKVSPIIVPELRLALAMNKYYKRKLSPRFISLGQQLLTGGEQSRTDKENRATDVDDPISGLQEYKAEVLEEGAVQNVDDIEEVLDIEDIMVEEVEQEEDKAWPTLGEQEPADGLSEDEYQELITLGETVLQEEPETEAPEKSNIATEPEQPAAETAEGPRDLHSFCEQLTRSEDRDDIATCLIQFLGQEFAAGGILMVKGDQVTGWQATVGGKPVKDFDRFHVALDQPSVMLTVAQSKSYYLGPLPETVHNIQLMTHFGSKVPETVLLIPLLLRGRLVSALYVQDHVNTISDKLADLQRLVSKSSMAFEMLVLKNKILMS